MNINLPLNPQHHGHTGIIFTHPAHPELIDLSLFHQFRNIFIALVEEIYCHLGHDLPVVIHDADHPLMLTIEWDGVSFDLIHMRSKPDYILGQCRLGHLPDTNRKKALINLLNINRLLYQCSEATLGLVEQEEIIVYAFTQPLKTLATQTLLNRLTQAAHRVQQWRTEGSFQFDTDLGLRGKQQNSYNEMLIYSRMKFMTLVDELCEEIDADTWDALASDELNTVFKFHIDEIAFRLIYVASERSYLVLECDIGSNPDEESEETLQRLLLQNYYLTYLDKASFAIDMTSARTLYIWRDYLDLVNSESLLDLIFDIAELRYSDWHDMHPLAVKVNRMDSSISPLTLSASSWPIV